MAREIELGVPRSVHVLGNAGMDVMLHVGRAPRDGETVIAHAVARAPGGKGLNQAVVAARSGARVRFQAVIGNDADAGRIRDVLAREPIAALCLSTSTHPTDLSVVIVDGAGGNRIVSTSACADALTPGDATAFASTIQAGDILLLQGNLSRDATHAAACVAADRRAHVVLNLAPVRWGLWTPRPRFHVIVNRTEATQATGLDDPHEAARALCRAGAASAVVTLGERGCILAQGADCRAFPASTMQAVDSTGAGDTFCGMFAAGLSIERPFADSIARAQRAAAITVSRRGVFSALPSVADLLTLCG